MSSIDELISGSREDALDLVHRLVQRERAFLLRSDVIEAHAEMREERPAEDSAAREFDAAIELVQEAAVNAPWVLFATRPGIGQWIYVRINAESFDVEIIETGEYLAFKESLVLGRNVHDGYALEIDFGPFEREFPKMKEPRSIGRGVEFLNRRLSSQLFDDRGAGQQKLLEFLRVHQVRGHRLMIDDAISDVRQLRRAVASALRFLGRRQDDEDWSDIAGEMYQLGFLAGWGRDVANAKSMLELLSELLEAPDPRVLEAFLARVPMIFSVAIISPHGFFGQANVLGRPDTGGQVVYILDQVRALEREMRRRIEDQGLDIEPRIVVLSRLIPEADGTTCDQRLEPIDGTEYARILRVPFRDEEGRVVQEWISRFHIWPYLERFARESETELVAELQGRPSLVVGNYSDGNLVATILSERLGVTQCNIAHALEKTKYLLSELYWQDNEDRYHFSTQFTADLIAMNAAEFIITSTYQEIAGTEESVGQYESYSAFSLPGLYRVVNGIELYDPKFNIVSPGADAEVFFPYTEEERRASWLASEIEEMIVGQDPRDDARGTLADPDKPLVFTMARLDRIKNITGLVEWYARSAELRERANLLVVAGFVDASHSSDAEEEHQIGVMHELFDEHGLDGQVRWLGMRLDKVLTGELYRSIADRRGVFVQPALFEAFGLTVVEAMSCGVPTFATCYGGPLEIIVDGRSGFHLDPNHGEEATAKISEFFRRCEDDPGTWDRLSQGALQRVRERYTWELYAERMMTLSRVYGFWKFVTHFERSETRRYLDALYGLQLRPRAGMVTS